MVNDAISRLKNGDDLPYYFAKVYGQSGESDIYAEDPKNAFNNFSRGKQVIANFVEKTPDSLISISDKLAQNNNDFATLNFTLSLGIQLCDILKDLRTRDVIWVDLKPGNLLLRSDNTVVIADKKGFYPKEKISLKKWNEKKPGSQEFSTVFLFDVPKSPVYLSENGENTLDKYVLKSSNGGPLLAKDTTFNDLERQSIDARDKFFSEMQKEYSYQLALILYMTVTNTREKDNNNNDNDEFLNLKKNGFDFSHPIFNSPAGGGFFGEILGSIIQKLGDFDPDERLNLDFAKNELEVIQQYLLLSRNSELQKQHEKFQKNAFAVAESILNKLTGTISSNSDKITNALKEILTALSPTQVEILSKDNSTLQNAMNATLTDLNVLSIAAHKTDDLRIKKEIALRLFQTIANDATPQQFDLLVKESTDKMSSSMKILRERRKGYTVTTGSEMNFTDSTTYADYLKALSEVHIRLQDNAENKKKLI